MSCRKIVMSLPFFQFTANLEQSGSWIPDTKSVKLIFSLMVTFCPTKTESRSKKSLTQLSHYCFDKSTILATNVDFLQKNADISKNERALVQRGISSETTYECVLACQI